MRFPPNRLFCLAKPEHIVRHQALPSSSIFRVKGQPARKKGGLFVAAAVVCLAVAAALYPFEPVFAQSAGNQTAALAKKLGDAKLEVVRKRAKEISRLSEAAAMQAAEQSTASGDLIEAAAILLPFFSPSQTTGSDASRLALGRSLVDLGASDEAIRILKPLATRPSARDTTVAMANFHLLKLAYEYGAWREATAYFTKSRDQLPADELIQALYWGGNSYLRIDEFMKAVEALDRIPEQSPLYPFALYSSGLAYLSMGDAYSSTLLRLQALIRLGSTAPSPVPELIDKTRVTLGYLFVDQKRYAEAVDLFSKISEKSVYADQSLFGLGWAYVGMGECIKAIVMFEALIQKFPESPYAREAWLSVGSCYSTLNAYNRAIDKYRDALSSYLLQRKLIRQISDQVQSTPVDKWGALIQPVSSSERPEPLSAPFKPPTETDLSVAPPPGTADRIWVELLVAPPVTGAMNLLKDVRRFEQAVAAKQRMDGSSEAWKVHVKVINVLRSEIESHVRKTAVGQLDIELQRVEEMAMHANIGIAKNLGILVENADR